MLKTIRFAAVLLLGAFVLAGCDESKDSTKSATEKAKDAAGGAANAVTNVAEQAKEAAGDAVEAVKKQADELMAKAKQFIEEKKLDDASKIIDQLKALKEKLPSEYQAKVDEIVKMFDAAKLVPALPGGN